MGCKVLLDTAGHADILQVEDIGYTKPTSTSGFYKLHSSGPSSHQGVYKHDETQIAGDSTQPQRSQDRLSLEDDPLAWSVDDSSNFTTDQSEQHYRYNQSPTLFAQIITTNVEQGENKQHSAREASQVKNNIP